MKKFSGNVFIEVENATAGHGQANIFQVCWTKAGPDCYELSGGLDDSRRTRSSCSIV